MKKSKKYNIFRRHLCLKNHIYKVDFCFWGSQANCKNTRFWDWL